jgi:hypothetical protein
MNVEYSISKNSEQSILAPFRQLAERVGVGLMNVEYSISKNSEQSSAFRCEIFVETKEMN